MADLIRDTAFGHLIRFVTRSKYLQYAEERDPSIWTRYIDEKKSAHLAHHGDTNSPEDGAAIEGLGGVRTRENGGHDSENGGHDSETSSQTRVGEEGVNHASGVKVDTEKGKDVHLVTWYGDNDPENPMNWSLAKRIFVTAEICLLTTSVYIGSSIYSAGTQDVMAIFGVSRVAATLGLTLFVAGYGIVSQDRTPRLNASRLVYSSERHGADIPYHDRVPCSSLQ